MKKSQTPELLGISNKKVIINILKKEGPLSRAEISRKIGMSFPAVSSNIAYLLDNEYIKEVGEGNNAMGRKSTLIDFNAKKGYVLGIDLGRYQFRLMIADLLGNPISVFSNKVESKTIKNDLITQLKTFINESLESVNINLNDIISVGIGIPGVLDKKSGYIILAPYAEEWQKLNIMQEMKNLFKCPIAIDNSVNYGSVGEKWNGCGKSFSNIVYINYGIGIGSALIINDELFAGSNGTAGEIGYLATSSKFIRNQYKEIGILEENLSGAAIDRKIKDAKIGVNSFKEIFNANNEAAKALIANIFEDIEKNFAIILINISAILNPEAIILSGAIGINIGKRMVSKWNDVLASNLPYPPKLLISDIDNKANVYGAVIYALKCIEDSFLSI